MLRLSLLGPGSDPAATRGRGESAPPPAAAPGKRERCERQRDGPGGAPRRSDPGGGAIAGRDDRYSDVPGGQDLEVRGRAPDLGPAVGSFRALPEPGASAGPSALVPSGRNPAARGLDP